MIVHYGTDKESGYDILKPDSQFELSRVGKDKNLWLGDGVYFFEDNEKMALEWCKAEGYSRGYNEYLIIVSTLRSKDSEVFD